MLRRQLSKEIAMEKFIKVGDSRINADKLLLITPEKVINTGEETGYATLVFEGNVERQIPLCGQTVDEILGGLIAESV